MTTELAWMEMTRVTTDRRTQQRLVARERRRDARRLSDALEGDQLRLLQQRRVRLSDGMEVAIETSPAWPRRGLTLAAALPARAGDPVADRVGAWMLSAGCTLAACNRRCPVSVPLPASMLRDPGLPEEVDAALAGCSIPGSLLELRLPEAGLADPDSALLLVLTALRDRGVQLAVDDFGARHGSLMLLRCLPVNAIRLDPSLTYDLADSPQDARILEAVAAIAHARSMRVIACVVEGARHAALARLGVDEAVAPLRRPA